MLNSLRPTRDQNILDLFCTDNPSLVQPIAVNKPELSDHSLVSVLISIPVTELDGFQSRRAIDDGVTSLDFSKANYHGISEAIGPVGWTQLESQHGLQDYPVIFTKILQDICKKYVSNKRPRAVPGKSSRPREVNALKRMRKRVQQKILIMGEQTGTSRYASLERKLMGLNLQIKNSYQQGFERKELAAISD